MVLLFLQQVNGTSGCFTGSLMCMDRLQDNGHFQEPAASQQIYHQILNMQVLGTGPEAKTLHHFKKSEAL